MGTAFTIANVRVAAKNALEVQLSQAADAIDAADPRDCFNPNLWMLSGGPLVVNVAQLDNVINGTKFLRLDLDSPLADNGAYTIALSGSARSLYGFPVDSTPISVTGPRSAGLAGQQAGKQLADITPKGKNSGDLDGLSRLDALKARLYERMLVRKNSFRHLPTFGRGIESGRNYSLARLTREVSLLKADILTDPDVKSCVVKAIQEGHVVTLSLYVDPAFKADAFLLSQPITAGDVG